MPAKIKAYRVLTQADLDRYAQLSGDHNPIHVDPVFAANTHFGATVAHGMLLFSLVRGLLAQHYPGRRLISQTLMFPTPAFVADPLRLTLTPAASDASSGTTIETSIVRSDGRACLEGRCQLAQPHGEQQ